MEHAVGDYVIVGSAKGAKHLVKLTKVGGDTVKGVLDNTLGTDSPETLSFDRLDILVNVGVRPRPGKVYGVTVEPYIKAIQSKRWGEIHSHVRMKPEKEKEVLVAFSKVHQWLEANSLLSAASSMRIELRPKQPTGDKYAGWYKFKSKGTDILCIKPQSQEPLLYILSHEYGHGLWYRSLSDKQKARWVGVYHEACEVERRAQEQLSKLRKDLQKIGNVSHFLKELEDDERLIFRAALSYISKVHHLNSKNLDALLAEQEHTTIQAIWPTKVEIGKPKALISDYGRKSVEELFAEAVAFSCSGKKLPKSITKLLEFTFKTIR